MACKILTKEQIESLIKFMQMLRKDAETSVAARLCLQRLEKLYIF